MAKLLASGRLALSKKTTTEDRFFSLYEDRFEYHKSREDQAAGKPARSTLPLDDIAYVERQGEFIHIQLAGGPMFVRVQVLAGSEATETSLDAWLAAFQLVAVGVKGPNGEITQPASGEAKANRAGTTASLAASPDVVPIEAFFHNAEPPVPVSTDPLGPDRAELHLGNLAWGPGGVPSTTGGATTKVEEGPPWGLGKYPGPHGFPELSGGEVQVIEAEGEDVYGKAVRTATKSKGRDSSSTKKGIAKTTDAERVLRNSPLGKQVAAQSSSPQARPRTKTQEVRQRGSSPDGQQTDGGPTTRSQTTKTAKARPSQDGGVRSAKAPKPRGRARSVDGDGRAKSNKSAKQHGDGERRQSEGRQHGQSSECGISADELERIAGLPRWVRPESEPLATGVFDVDKERGMSSRQFCELRPSGILMYGAPSDCVAHSSPFLASSQIPCRTLSEVKPIASGFVVVFKAGRQVAFNGPIGGDFSLDDWLRMIEDHCEFNPPIKESIVRRRTSSPNNKAVTVTALLTDVCFTTSWSKDGVKTITTLFDDLKCVEVTQTGFDIVTEKHGTVNHIVQTEGEQAAWAKAWKEALPVSFEREGETDKWRRRQRPVFYQGEVCVHFGPWAEKCAVCIMQDGIAVHGNMEKARKQLDPRIEIPANALRQVRVHDDGIDISAGGIETVYIRLRAEAGLERWVRAIRRMMANPQKRAAAEADKRRTMGAPLDPDTVLMQGALGFYDGGRLSTRWAVLFQSRLEAWDSQGECAGRHHPRVVYWIDDIEDVQAFASGVVLAMTSAMPNKKVGLHVVGGEAQAQQWASKLREAIDAAANAPRMHIEGGRKPRGWVPCNGKTVSDHPAPLGSQPPPAAGGGGSGPRTGATGPPRCASPTPVRRGGRSVVADGTAAATGEVRMGQHLPPESHAPSRGVVLNTHAAGQQAHMAIERARPPNQNAAQRPYDDLHWEKLPLDATPGRSPLIKPRYSDVRNLTMPPGDLNPDSPRLTVKGIKAAATRAVWVKIGHGEVHQQH